MRRFTRGRWCGQALGRAWVAFGLCMQGPMNVHDACWALGPQLCAHSGGKEVTVSIGGGGRAEGSAMEHDVLCSVDGGGVLPLRLRALDAARRGRKVICTSYGHGRCCALGMCALHQEGGTCVRARGLRRGACELHRSLARHDTRRRNTWLANTVPLQGVVVVV